MGNIEVSENPSMYHSCKQTCLHQHAGYAALNSKSSPKRLGSHVTVSTNQNVPRRSTPIRGLVLSLFILFVKNRFFRLQK